jgi:hypothetical protein
MVASRVTLKLQALLITVLAIGPQSNGVATERDPCGDPKMVSQAYSSFHGTVRRVIDPVTLMVEIAEQKGFAPFPGCTQSPCVVAVRLVNLRPPSEAMLVETSQRSLSIETLAKEVSLDISPVQGTPGVTNARVTSGDRDINLTQLEGGFASYESFGPYALDWYLECKHKQAQDRAQEA